MQVMSYVYSGGYATEKMLVACGVLVIRMVDLYTNLWRLAGREGILEFLLINHPLDVLFVIKEVNVTYRINYLIW